MKTFPPKVVAIAVLSCVALGSTVDFGMWARWSILTIVVMLAVIDASQCSIATNGSAPVGRPIFSALCDRAVWPFYVLVILLTWFVMAEREARAQAQSATSLSASRGWGPDGNLHAPGGSGRCACGKPLGHDQSQSLPPGEVSKRIESLKKRTFSPAPKGIPAANLPGIGPNARPLHPTVVPNEKAPLPGDARKALDQGSPPKEVSAPK